MSEKFILGEEFKGIDRLPDSMCLDSNTFVCSYEDNGDIVEIVVRGYVTVDFNGNRYTCFSNMPEELQKLFETGKAYEDERVYISENNWYEVFYNTDEDYDVAEIDGDYVKNLENYCKDCMELFRQ